VAGAIGSSLDAEVDLYVDDDTRAMLAALEDELRFVFITSYARVHAADEHPAAAVDAELADRSVWIRVTPSTHNKCSRCWHHREDVGSHDMHPEICMRCIDNVDGAGETRRYA
jgi:isoleucyl-tRNA synthetase